MDDGRWLALGGVAAIAAAAWGRGARGSGVRLGPLLSSSSIPLLPEATWIPYEGKTIEWFKEQPSKTEFLLAPWDPNQDSSFESESSPYDSDELQRWVVGINRFSAWLLAHPVPDAQARDRERAMDQIAADLGPSARSARRIVRVLAEVAYGNVYQLRHHRTGLVDFRIPKKPIDASLGFMVDHAVAWRPPQRKPGKRTKGSGVRLGPLLEGPRFLRATPVFGAEGMGIVGAVDPGGRQIWSANIRGSFGGQRVFEAWWDTKTRRMIFFSDGPWRGNADIEVVNEDGSLAYSRNPARAEDRVPFSQAPERLVQLMAEIDRHTLGSTVRLGPLLGRGPEDRRRAAAREVRRLAEAGDVETLNDFWMSAVLRVPVPVVPVFVTALAQQIHPGWGKLGVRELVGDWAGRLDTFARQPSEVTRDVMYELGHKTKPETSALLEQRLVELVLPTLSFDQIQDYLAYCREYR